MKKKVFLFIIICILVVLSFFGLYYFFIDNKPSNSEEVNKTYAGTKVSDGIYYYDLNLDDSYHNMYYSNGYFTYLIDNDDYYELYNVDIYTNEVKKIKDISYDYYCHLTRGYYDCYNEEQQVIYDYKGDVVYEGKYLNVIPFNDGYYKIENNAIYYNNEEVDKFKKDISNYNVYDSKLINGNLYLYLTDVDTDSLIYSVKDKDFVKIDYSYNLDYDNGLYYFKDNKIYIYDLVNNTKTNKKISIEYDSLMPSRLVDNNIYYFIDDYFKIYDIDKNTNKLIDYRINEYFNDMLLNDNKLYLFGNNKAYIINLDEVTYLEKTPEELNNFYLDMINSKVDKIKEDYLVEIFYAKDADLKFDAFKENTVGERGYNAILDSLDEADTAFSYFGKDFFKEFIHDDYKGLRVYLVNEIKANFSMSGEQFRYYDNYAIIVQTCSFKSTIYHELLHTLEDAVGVKHKEIFEEWSSYNPKDFKYVTMDDYDPVKDYKYTLRHEGTDVYFIDNYAEVNELEDRARLFEHICVDNIDDINNNPYLLKKAHYLVSEIKKHYPMLSDFYFFSKLN